MNATNQKDNGLSGAHGKPTVPRLRPYTSMPGPVPPVSLSETFGIRSVAQVAADLRHILARRGGGFQLGLSSLGHLRPDLSLRAYARQIPADGRAPIMNLFDRVGGGRNYSQRVTKRSARDFRGETFTYDEHDGVDFVCPVGTCIVAAAPGIVTLVRDRWLRGGLTVTVDHGNAVSTQYTHLSRVLVPVGTRVRRGEAIALSGAAGIDLTLFFPWVAPHLHFMVWHRGVPVDPFLCDDEDRQTAVWTERNMPRAPANDDALAPEPLVDASLARTLSQQCVDPRIAQEIEGVRHEPAALVALLEDSFHHDRFAWPSQPSAAGLRRDGRASVAISMPLDPQRYAEAFMADGSATN